MQGSFKRGWGFKKRELGVTEGNKSWREVKALAFLGIFTTFLVSLDVSVYLYQVGIWVTEDH